MDIENEPPDPDELDIPTTTDDLTVEDPEEAELLGEDLADETEAGEERLNSAEGPV